MPLDKEQLQLNIYNIVNSNVEDFLFVLNGLCLLELTGVAVSEEMLAGAEANAQASRPGFFGLLMFAQAILSREDFTNLCSLPEVQSIVGNWAEETNVKSALLKARKSYKEGNPIWTDFTYDNVIGLFSCLPEIEELRLRSYEDDDLEEVALSSPEVTERMLDSSIAPWEDIAETSAANSEQEEADEEIEEEFEEELESDEEPAQGTIKEIKSATRLPSILKELGTGSDSDYEILNSEKTLSIEPKTSYSEFWSFIQANAGSKFVASLKINGINTKTAYKEGNYTLTLSKGRSGNSIDFTKVANLLLPATVSKKDTLVVYAEAWVEDEYLPVLRSKYGVDKYKTSRSSALSMLQVGGTEEDLAHLHLTVFSGDNIGGLDRSIAFAQDEGFEVVPHKVIEWDEIPKSFGDFMPWAQENIFDAIWEEGKQIPSDGIVFEALTTDDVVKGQYSSKNISLKMEHWSYLYYRGIVKKILSEQRRVSGSLRVEIEPLRLVDGCEAGIVNVYNPSILFEAGIRVGSEVYFERASGVYSNLLYGERLAQVLKGNSF